MVAAGFMMRALRTDISIFRAHAQRGAEGVNYSKEEIAEFVATLDESGMRKLMKIAASINDGEPVPIQ
jgi:hypothetical protein